MKVLSILMITTTLMCASCQNPSDNSQPGNQTVNGSPHPKTESTGTADIVPSSFSVGNKGHITQNALKLTETEIVLYRSALPRICEIAATEANRRWQHNQEFYKRHQISPYFSANYDNPWKGPRNSSRLKQDLTRLGKYHLVDELSVSDCVIVSRNPLQVAFEETGCHEIWDKLDRYTRTFARNRSDFNGLPFMQGLRYLGWRTYYWCPESDVNAIHAWDAEDRRNYGSAQHPAKGDHFWWYKKVVLEGGNYETNTPIDDRKSLVGFKDRPPLNLMQVKFCLGVMNRGYHIFPIVSGDVIEGHRVFKIDSLQNVEKAPFNPLIVKRNGFEAARGGGNAGPAWINNARGLSGVISVPPHLVF